jgi:hypothetical protein
VASGLASERRQKRFNIYNDNEIIILNYEKLGNDFEELYEAIKGKRIF